MHINTALALKALQNHATQPLALRLSHLMTSVNAGSKVGSSRSGPNARVLIMDARTLNSGPQRGVTFDPKAPPTCVPPP